MQVKVLETTSEKPASVISKAAGTCYGKDDYNWLRIVNCYRSGHMSVFEHAWLSFKVEGISRACSHQLVRHRLASYSQQSQRYCRYELDSADWFVVPPDVAKDPKALREYRIMLEEYAANYKYLMATMKLKPEDARYLLPEAMKTDIVVSMNLREFYHFLDMRRDQKAQWEIRQLTYAMYDAVRSYNEQWNDLMELWAEGAS